MSPTKDLLMEVIIVIIMLGWVILEAGSFTPAE